MPILTAENAELIDIALEGTSNAGPRPTVPELASVFDRLQEVRLKQARAAAKQAVQPPKSRATRAPRGRSRGQSTSANQSAPAQASSSRGPANQ